MREGGFYIQIKKGIIMRELNTIQKRDKLNTVFASDEIGAGGANHEYVVSFTNAVPEDDAEGVKIQFQHGARKDENAIHGVLDTDLLEIVRDRLKGFQNGDFATRENAITLTHIEEALLWMNKRVEDRAERNVLGTYKK